MTDRTTAGRQRTRAAGRAVQGHARACGDRRTRVLRRLAAAVAGLLVAAFLIVVAALPTLADGGPVGTGATVTVLVTPSDTLWSIAESHALPRVSTPAAVAALRELNDLETSDVAAGSVLRVPVAEHTDAHMAGEIPSSP